MVTLMGGGKGNGKEYTVERRTRAQTAQLCIQLYELHAPSRTSRRPFKVICDYLSMSLATFGCRMRFAFKAETQQTSSFWIFFLQVKYLFFVRFKKNERRW